ncbi:Tol-pal system protein YbgF [Sterolibacterium denitrificans]|uniref:Cell division coordinator CpoB n=1 Tax=Sterolibacterium denitrificans TaxID=157592 RepID=A0A7Z7MTS9_9PROT|nr:tol-pal system protein YbgF [Sterolibacterium denitrificans]SMB20984.1 Tol-pal system protein YbgF [Sterolibacterium denitrificans]
MRRRLPRLLLVIAGSAGFALPAQAGLFDDAEARNRIENVRSELVEHGKRLDEVTATANNATRSQLDLANQIEQLKTDVAKLRGQVEVVAYELDAAQKRQKDFYIDLDSRLRKLEPVVGNEAADGAGSAEGVVAAAAATATAAPDPAVEMRDYEAALTLFKGARYKEAAAAFEGFIKNHGSSTLLPNAHYWAASAYYQQRQFQKAAGLFAKVPATWPADAKAPDALLGQANSLRDSGDIKGARAALEMIIQKYPNSTAAQAARPRLQK